MKNSRSLQRFTPKYPTRLKMWKDDIRVNELINYFNIKIKFKNNTDIMRESFLCDYDYKRVKQVRSWKNSKNKLKQWY